MVVVKFTKRELADLLGALDYAMEDYAGGEKIATTDEERALYERSSQRACALYNKLSAAQEKAK